MCISLQVLLCAVPAENVDSAPSKGSRVKTGMLKAQVGRFSQWGQGMGWWRCRVGREYCVLVSGRRSRVDLHEISTDPRSQRSRGINSRGKKGRVDKSYQE